MAEVLFPHESSSWKLLSTENKGGKAQRYLYAQSQRARWGLQPEAQHGNFKQFSFPSTNQLY